MALTLKSLGRSISNFLGSWPRPVPPPRYSDGWQTGTPWDAANGQGPVTGFAALRRGIEILTGQLVSTPLLVFDGAKELPDSIAAQILANTHPADIETAISDFIQTGNGWLQLVGDRFECIQAFRVSAVLRENKVVYLVDSGSEIDLATTAHLMTRNHFSPYVGDALLESYSESAALMLASLSIYRQIQSNGSFADVHLSTDSPMTSAQMLEMKNRYADTAGNNTGKAGGVVILSHGLKPLLLRKLPTALEADVIRSLDFSVEESARMLGIPLSLLSCRETGQAYNSAVEGSRSFYRATLRPLFHRVERELSRVLGATISYDVQDVMMGYGSERIEFLSKALHSGVLNIDEARAALAYTAMPDGKGTAHFVPSSQIELGKALAPVPEPPEPKEAEVNVG